MDAQRLSIVVPALIAFGAPVVAPLDALTPPAAAQPGGGQWDPTLPQIISAGAPGDPVAIANASLQATGQAAQITMDLGRKFLSTMGILPDDAPAGAVGRVHAGSQGAPTLREDPPSGPPADLPPRSALERLLHRLEPLGDHRPDRGSELVREQVGDPHRATAPLAFREDLHRGVVVRHAAAHDSPCEPPGAVVQIDDPLAPGERSEPWRERLRRNGYVADAATFGAALDQYQAGFMLRLHVEAQAGAAPYPFVVEVVCDGAGFPVYCPDLPSALELLERLVKIADADIRSVVEREREEQVQRKLQELQVSKRGW